MTNKNKRLLSGLTLGALTIIGTQATAAVPNIFSSGSAAIASEMNDNFDSLDQRINTLESSGSSMTNMVEVNCSSDANALLNTELQNGVEYVLTGMCNGPIKITGNKVVKLIGDANGVKDDGIMLPSGLTTHPVSAVGAYGPNELILENLTISGSNYVTNIYSFGDGVSVIGAGRNAVTYLTNVDVIGGDYAVSAFRGGVITINEGVTVTEFNINGIVASSNGVIEVRNPITVTSSLSSTAEYSAAIGAYRNASVEIKGGGSFTPSTGTIDSSAIQATENGTIRIREGGTTVLNGTLGAFRSSVVRVDSGTLNGDIQAGDGSALRLINLDINAPNNLINFYRNATGDFRGSTDLGNVNIQCSGSVSVKNTVTNKALVCGGL